MTNTSNKIYDVAIIGFGPTGATIANLLGLEGISTVVIERDSEIFDQPRAIGFDHEIMRIFQNAGVAKDVLPATAPMASTHYTGAKGQVIREFHQLPPPHPFGWSPNFTFDQPSLESGLRQGVARHDTIDVYLRHEMERFEELFDCVKLNVRDLDNNELKEFKAKYVVACDGASSPTRQGLDIKFEDLGFDEPWIVIDVYAKNTNRLPQVNQQMCNPERPMTFIVGPNNHRRWEIMMMPGEKPEDIDQIERIYELLEPFGPPEEFEIRRSATYRFHALVAATWRKDRVLLAGDAAHQTPPFIGQGMCQGIRDASAVCWRLKAILKDGISDSILDSYTEERKPHVETTTIRTKGLGKEICMLDPVKAAARDAALEKELKEGNQNVIRQGLIPGLESGALDLLASGKPANDVGTLVRQPRVELPNGQKQLLDDVVGGAFLVIVNAAKEGVSLTQGQQDFWQSIGGKVVSIARSGEKLMNGSGSVIAATDLDGLLIDYMEEQDCTAVIVRPDHYIYGVVNSAEDLERQINDLEKFMVPQ
jgi:3-(3-hydroxy-phenyl)propionate hydroxylase